MTEADVRRIAREEIRAALGKSDEPRRYRQPCGRGNSIPQCMGSAALGPDGCTCPGVKIEWVRMGQWP